LSAENDEMAYSRARKRMVLEQIQSRGIRDKRVLDAFRTVPRHLFVGADLAGQAYRDHPLSIGRGQTISQPYMVAIMTEKLQVSEGDKTLEIGTGSGYQTAILAQMGARVYTVERLRELSERARENLQKCGYEGIHFRVGDGTLGWPQEAPFDRIIATAGAPSIPQPLLDQLADDGRMVIPVGERHGQVLTVVHKKQGRFTTETSGACVFVKLVGAHGWREG